MISSARLDGRLKVKGAARFAAEFPLEKWFTPLSHIARFRKVGSSS